LDRTTDAVAVGNSDFRFQISIESGLNLRI
jgi:hypothetical protein